MITQQQIEQWIMNTTGKFYYKDIMDGVVKQEDYPKLRVILGRLKEKGKVYPVGDRDGWWRPADREVEEVCWWESEGEIGDNILFPLGLNKYCYIPLPSLIIVAGRYNAGKTAFCINLVNYNLDKWENKMDFYVSEGAEMMNAKFKALNSFIPKPPPFRMIRRTENFADILQPDNLSIIDYLRVDMQRVYEIGNALFAIFNKLNKGIAVVAMQKPPGDRKLAFGGASTAFEPSLYLGMESVTKDSGWMGFEKIKVPKIIERDPYNMKITYKLKNGVNFYDIHEDTAL